MGASPGVAAVLAGLTAEDRALLRRWAEGGEAEEPAPDRAAVLLDLLVRVGMVDSGPRPDPSPTTPDVAWLSADPAADALSWGLALGRPGADVLARRTERSVAVVGQSRVATALAHLLRLAGVPTAAASPPRPTVPGAGALDVLAHDLIVVVHAGAADADATAPLVCGDVPHLSLVVREIDGVVGPLVVPGRTACLSCLDHHRTREDPQWPEVVRQLSAAPPGPSETTLTALLSGAAAGLALEYLDARGPWGRPATTVQLGLGGLGHARRTWQPHPDCGCVWPPGAAAAGDSARERDLARRIGA
ncbi:MAG: hypothetical protein U0Q15_10555 [Kineosporiaceae bacterium]